MSDVFNLLVQALFAIYSRAGAEVTYVTERGETRKYWANRYRQALQRAIENDTVGEFVERLVTQDEPSRGFGYLHAANRLDLSVEALVADESRPYHGLFSLDAVAAARNRLDEFGYTGVGDEEAVLHEDLAAAPSVEGRVSEAFELDLKMRVDVDGSVSLRVVR